jgi:hypothetical protein
MMNSILEWRPGPIANGAAAEYNGGMEPRRLLAAIASPAARVKFGAAKELRTLSEHEPGRLYSHFDFFDPLRHSENSVLRWNAILVVGNLAAVDSQHKIDAILDDFLAPIRGPHLIDAANTIRAAAAVATAKPYLAGRIAHAILQVESANYQTDECRRVAAGHAIVAFTRLMPLLDDKGPVERFVTRQLESSRAATRKKAQAFLRRFHSLQKCAT